MNSQTKTTMDGNTAAAHVAYAFTEVASIYPITPSSVMADQVDKFSCSNKKNIFGSKVQVVEMQSEAGAAGTMHGALSAGALSTSFTSSQGLLLMIPNMYKIAGELMPNVIHVAARSIATHALSIFGEHSDIYACRQTGYAMLCSNNPQEVAHMAAIAHLSSIKSSVPFLHFFDGFRTSHEIQKVDIPSYDDLKELMDWSALEKFRKRALNPNTPLIRGTAQNDDVYFQNREASNTYYTNSIDIVDYYMKQINKKYHTTYKPFEYYGSPTANRVIIAMGSVCETMEEVVDYLTAKGENVGIIKVRLYRPFSAKHLLEVIPNTVTKIAVLDRTKEAGSIGEPLYLDVLGAINGFKNFEMFSGRYGLSSKNTTPAQIIAVFENMLSSSCKHKFTIGINDDVTNLSLPVDLSINTIPSETYSCKLWGIGSDGTISASKNTIKIIGNNTSLNVQGFFSYDSKKSGGTTVSHLRFGKKPIKSTYYIEKADFIACHTDVYLTKYDILKDLKPNGKFLLNCSFGEEELEKKLPNKVKKILAEKNVQFYILDANNISRKLGLGGRVNTALQAAFFKIVNIFEPDKSLELIKEYIYKTYSKKGLDVVDLNNKSAEEGMKNLKKITVPSSWKNINTESPKLSLDISNESLSKFVTDIAVPVNSMDGNSLPVSAFLPYVDGSIPLGSAAYEKRSTADFVPCWEPENCIQCNLCSYVCPHAVIRPVITSENERLHSPTKLKSKKMIGFPEYDFSISISIKDCTGCGNCVEICPGMKGKKALEMKEFSKEINSQTAFDYSQKLPLKSDVLCKFKETTVKGSQFKKPLLEFSGACAGCGETPYAKLITQLFGDKMIIANATGCSSIWGASFPSSPYTTNNNGKGPAWHNSLFEDNAEFGYGISLAQKYLRNALIETIKNISYVTLNEELKTLCQNYISTLNYTNENSIASDELIKFLECSDSLDIPDKTIDLLTKNKNLLSKKSVWIIGGDGWAYDIGFGGLDHVLASKENVNILVFDTEVYSNTGGQASKSTPAGAIAQFAAFGKSTPKKDLASMAMSYGHVYVAQVALGANYNQCIKAIVEAEHYNGPSLIIAYSPCINHGIKGGMKNSLLASKRAVDSGYWQPFRFNPENVKNDKPLMILEKPSSSITFEDFLLTESRYIMLKNSMPQKFKDLSQLSYKQSIRKMDSLNEINKK